MNIKGVEYMSCCNSRNNRENMREGCRRNACDYDNRRGYFPINWGHCRDNRSCPRRGPLRPGFRRPY